MYGVNLRPSRGLLMGLGFAAVIACDEGTSLDVVEGRLTVPDTIEFGAVQVGLRRTLALEVTNTGSGVSRVTDIQPDAAAVSDAYSFSVDARSFIVPPGQTRQVAIEFQPFAVGDAQASLTVLTDETDARPRTVTVRGQGIRSGLEIVPNPVDFGAVLAGASRTLDVRVFNRLSDSVDVLTALDRSGAPTITNQGGRGRFEVLTPEADARGALTNDLPLEPGEALDVQLRYVPDPSQLDGEDRGLWVLRNCDAPVCELGVTVVGRGTNAALRCSPSVVDFGRITPATTSTRTVTCENVVNEPVSLTGWQVSVDTPDAFRVPATPQARVIPPGASFEVEVAFSPSLAALGTTLEGALLVRGRNPIAGRDLDPAAVTLTGAAGGPDIEVLPPVLPMGAVALGTRKARGLLIANTGFEALTIEAITVESGPFTVDRTSFVVPPGDSQVVRVTFNPQMVGEASSVVRIRSNDSDEAVVTVDVTGVGVERPPCTYSIMPAAVRFGIVQVLRSASQGVRIQNTGADDCWLSDVRVEPATTSYFGVDAVGANGPSEEVVLRPGEAYTALVSYTPQASGEHRGTLGMYVSSPTAPNPQVELSGFGSDAALLISPNDIDFGRVGVGCSSRTQRVAVYNTGATQTVIDRIERPATVSGEFLLENLPAGLPGQRINAGQAIEFDIRYEAADLGRDTGVVHVFQTGQSEPYVVSVLGEGARTPVNEDRFVQLETPEVDILFVIDNSCSMSEEQASLTANFQSFIQFAEQQALDYQIGVVSTDARNCPRPGTPDRPSRFDQGQCGYLADGNPTERNPAWRFIRPNTMPDAETAFGVVASQGINGSGSELGLEAAYRALTPPLITGWNSGFLRPSAYLALVFVSDEEDQSNNSIDFYVNAFLAIKGFRATNLFSASAIVGDPNDSCGPDADPGRRYIDVADRTGGIVERICTPNWADALRNLGLSVFGYKRRFFMSNQPAPGSVRLALDGVDVPTQGPNGQTNWFYDPMSNSVNFPPLRIPEPGTEIVVTYRAECL